MTRRAALEACLARISAHDARVGAFLHVDSLRGPRADALRAQADASDARVAAGTPLSPIDGVPVALKDNIAVAGEPLTAGSKILEGYRSPYDATVATRLRSAGAILLGRTNLDEMAMGSSTENSAWQRTKNPWDLERVPGGSSGGSAAAVSAGFVPLALGSDTGGSIRQPAALCGVVGLKPTWGRVSRFGLSAFASSLDVIGPFARDVVSAATLLEVIAGPDARDATCSDAPVPALAAAAREGKASGAHGKIVGVPRALLGDGLRDDVRDVLAAAEAALIRAGARVVDVVLPHAALGIAAYYVICTAEASSNLARLDGVRYGPRRGRTIGGVYEETRALFGPEVKRRIVLGSWVLSAGYYDAYTRRAQRVRRLVANDLNAALATCDALLLPTSPEPAWRFGAKADPLTMYLADAYTVLASLAGLPAASVNAGFSREGLPVGAQLVARAFDEASLVSVAGALEASLALPAREPTGLSSSSSSEEVQL